MRKRFIVFDGIDGSGKTTQITKSAEYLYKTNVSHDNILLTREPTYSAIGARIRKLLDEETNPSEHPRKCLSWFIADRIKHLHEVIEPALEKNFLVLCDRYKYSTLAYQQAQGIPLEELILVQKNLLVPDLTIIIDVPGEEAYNRIKAKRKTTKFEEPEFLERVRQNFLALKKLLPKENIAVIKSEGTKEQVFEKVRKLLDKHFSRK